VGGAAAPPPAAGQPAGPRVRAHPGKAVYDQHCATCHGLTGGSDGPGAAALPIKPPPLTDGRLLNPLPDEFLHTVVRDGAGAVGLAPQMPAFGRLLTDREIRDVVAYVRTLAQPPYRPRPGPAVQPVAPAPAQPIEFSHAIHAGSYAIDCQYCHADARRSAFAGLPSVARCMGCHKIVAAQGNPEVQKLHQYWERKAPIPWVRVHKLAGFVYFPHKRHVQAPQLPCQTCHGPVEAMQRVAQVAPLTMGWCVACHAERRAPLDCVACHH
jgi:mono/diheme cytochrome c family protein